MIKTIDIIITMLILVLIILLFILYKTKKEQKSYKPVPNYMEQSNIVEVEMARVEFEKWVKNNGKI